MSDLITDDKDLDTIKQEDSEKFKFIKDMFDMKNNSNVKTNVNNAFMYALCESIIKIADKFKLHFLSEQMKEWLESAKSYQVSVNSNGRKEMLELSKSIDNVTNVNTESIIPFGQGSKPLKWKR